MIVCRVLGEAGDVGEDLVCGFEPLERLGVSSDDFCRQILPATPARPNPQCCLKNAISTTGC